MEANRKSAKKWNSKHMSIRTPEYRQSNSSDDARGHDQQLHQTQETCGLIKGVHYMPLYRRDSENPNTSNDSNCAQNNSVFQKRSSASYHGRNIRTSNNISNVKVSISDQHPHPHSFFQGKPILPQPRSAQLRTASLRDDEVHSYIPSPHHSSFKAASSSLLECHMHDRPVQWHSQIISDSNNPSNTCFRCNCLRESEKLDRTPLEDFPSLTSDASVVFFAQEARNSSLCADNSELNLRSTVDSPFIAGAYSLVSEVNSVSGGFGNISSAMPASKGIQLPPPPPDCNLHLESRPLLSSVNILANNGIPLAINLARSDLHHMSKQSSSSLLLPEGLTNLEDIKSGQSNNISIFKTSYKPDEVHHTSPASNKTVDDYDKLQAKLILADLDDNDSDYGSNDGLNQGAESINISTESLKTSLIGTNDCFGGADDEFTKTYSNMSSTLKRTNTPFNSQSTCQSTTPDAIKSAMTPAMGLLALDRSTTALFLQLTGEGEDNERGVRGSLYTSSSSAVPQVSGNIYDDDPRNGHAKDEKTLFSDLFSELTESRARMIPTDIKYKGVTETRCTLSADGVHIDISSGPVLQQPKSPMKAFCLDSEINPVMTDMLMGTRTTDPEDCIDTSKQVRPQAIKGASVPPLSVNNSANFGHTKLTSAGTLLPVWKNAFMPVPGRSPLYKTTAVKVQRPPLEAPLVTHRALACLFRETPQSMHLRGKILEKRLKVRPLVHSEGWPPETGIDVEKLLKQHKAIKLLRHLSIISFSRQHIKGVQELFNMWAQHGIPAPDMAFGAYYYYVKEKSEKLLCMKHNGRGATPGHGYGKCDFESRRPNNTCRYDHVCLFCRSRDHGWFEGDQCEGYQALLSEIEALGVLEEDANIMLEAMERASPSP
ncbi:unnamed protein product [Phytomonas sp. EM1]|nr:unnamed protein product [Phytomonas sp. EM1]|eukprot:CCW60827.1 unnamed protein product [Phytomonas sp. isolate EM1]